MLASLHVVLDGVTSVASVQPGQTLLEAAEAAGLVLPCVCRQGTCGACICRLMQGEVRLGDFPVLSKRDRACGLILACQALPRSPEIFISYDE